MAAIELVLGDITAERVDAVVTAANRWLAGVELIRLVAFHVSCETYVRAQ